VTAIRWQYDLENKMQSVARLARYSFTVWSIENTSHGLAELHVFETRVDCPAGELPTVNPVLDSRL